MDLLQKLQYAWNNLFLLFHVEPASSQPLFTYLVAAYSADERYYHTLEHVQSMLTIIDALSHHASNLPAIQLATWFHDYVYDTRSSDNEERSAAQASAFLTQLALPLEVVQSVQRMILSTKTH